VAGETLCTCGVEWKGGVGERTWMERWCRRAHSDLAELKERWCWRALAGGMTNIVGDDEHTLGSSHSDLHTHSNSTVRTMV
jgi:hypothetical protein